ncbi:hypothetical protein NDU88_002235 [Pleurodeles waltl]|uniref:Secreted protein n=1 Tax=Pleurodeles waltl TaxID=8319 RepID=A0AAV7M7J8_PLEWA|nr:hypothetical protein NDU88_002235 [Pleurodeles waltl]
MTRCGLWSQWALLLPARVSGKRAGGCDAGPRHRAFRLGCPCLPAVAGSAGNSSRSLGRAGAHARQVRVQPKLPEPFDDSAEA